MALYPYAATLMVRRFLHGRNWKAALLTEYVQDPDHKVFADVQGWEVSGSGYTSGGKNVTIEADFDSAGNKVVLVCPDVHFGFIGVPTTGAIVFYDDTGDASTSELLLTDNFGEEIAVDGYFFYAPNEAELTNLLIENETEINA